MTKSTTYNATLHLLRFLLCRVHVRWTSKYEKRISKLKCHLKNGRNYTFIDFPQTEITGTYSNTECDQTDGCQRKYVYKTTLRRTDIVDVPHEFYSN